MTTRAGTQSIERTVRILKAVAERKDIGWRLTDLCLYCGLGKTTTHRIVKCLVAERLLRQRAADRRYVPGPLLFELASALPAYMDFRDAMHAELGSIARRHHGHAFLHLRSHLETVCVDRVGSSSVHPLTVIGTRRPLTQSTAGVAILLSLSAAERDRIVALIRRGKLREAEKRRAQVYAGILRQSLQQGHAYSLGDVVPGLGAIAVPLHDQRGHAFGALGLMGPVEHYAGERLGRLVAALTREALRLQRSHRRLIAELAPESPDEATRSDRPARPAS